MQRYRSYGQTDDQPLVVGDEHFIGVDEYSNPENVQPAYVQQAVNCDFSSLNAETRGGFVCLPELAKNPFGTKWTMQTVSGTTTWNAVAYGNGLFVAVGVLATGYGAVMTSPDAVTWTVQTVASAPAFEDVVFANGQFVACGGLYGTATSGIRVSTDGITWSTPASNSNSQYNQGVAYGNGVWAILAWESSGTNWFIYRSSDNAVTWTKTLLTTSAGSNGNICYGNGQFVVTTQFSVYIWHSPDASTWSYTQITDVDPFGLSATDIVFGANQFAIVNYNGSIYTSSNGINWTRTRSRDAELVIWYAMIGNDSGVVVAGASGWGTLYSFNLTHWIKSNDISSSTYYGGVYANGTYVYVGASGAVAYSQTPLISVFGSSIYADPNEIGTSWIMLLGGSSVGFYAFGHASHTVSLGGYTVNAQSTIVQANNYVYIFRGDNAAPLYWNGDWNTSFALVPATTLPATYNSIPNSNQATYYQNRLWVRSGKDSVAASDVLAFTDYDPLANQFNLNTGNSDYVVATFPFGQTSLICFKNKSIELMQNVEGSLSDVTVTEITRQVGLVGINAVTSVGPDIAYVSYGNINLLTLTTTNNSLQHKTLPLSARIKRIMNRVNWNAAYKISIGYWNNKIYVALPLDNSLFCNAVVVYNFINESWYGEWNFSPDMNMCIQGWAVLDYLGLQRLHAVTEDGRIFVTDEGQNDISGTTVSEISFDLVTRAYHLDHGSNENRGASFNHFQRRMYADVSTNRPKLSVSSYTDGANEESTLLTDQTYTRSQSWLFNDDPYDLTNANDDYNRAYRRDYSTGPASVQPGSGIQPEMRQDIRLPLLTRRQGRLSWLEVSNTQGYIMLKSIGFENRAGQRSSYVQA